MRVVAVFAISSVYVIEFSNESDLHPHRTEGSSVFLVRIV